MTFTVGQAVGAADFNDFSPGTRIQVPDGTAGAPSITNTGDLDTGIFFHEDNGLTLVANATSRVIVDSDGSIVLRGITATVNSLYLRHADATGDTALFFGDGTDTAQAGFYYDQSATVLVLRSYDNTDCVRLEPTEQVSFLAGSTSAPSITFAGDLDCGIYAPAANQVGVTCGNTLSTLFTSTYVEVYDPIRAPGGSASAPGYSFTGATNYGMYQTGSVLRFSTAGTDRVQVGIGNLFAPVSNNVIGLGSATQRWTTVYSVNADDISSDMRHKIETGPVPGLDFVTRLRPFEGVRPDGFDDDRRLHLWLGAQDVAAALAETGRDPAGMAVWTKQAGEDGEESLAYTEFIPVLIAAVQELATLCGYDDAGDG